MERSAEALPIAEKDLAAYNQRVEGLLGKVAYAAKTTLDPAKRPAPGQMAWTPSPSSSAAAKETSIFDAAHNIPETRLVLDDKVNHVVNVVSQGLRIGLHLGKLYEKSSNAEALMEENRRGVLGKDHISEFQDKCYTAAAIVMFTTAYYVTWELSREGASDSKATVDAIPEVNLLNTVDALNCMLYYYGAFLKRPEVRTAEDFATVTRLYFKAFAAEIKNREGSLKYAEPFTSRAYKLEKGEFAVTGFALDLASSSANVQFNREDINEIVGNRRAKREAKLIAQRLACFDPATKRNPMHELGGLPKLRMGYGPPGTGKSKLTAATATMVSDYCQALGYPFSFRPLPDNIISTFQGGSAEKAVDWFVGFQDPTRIHYGSIDDGEVVLEDRTRQNVSAGVRELIGVFLRRTEGAYAVNHGNFAIDIFTNLPDQIDKAVLSRIVSRFLIDGARTREDFMDQDYLWWKKFSKIDPGFVDMEGDPAYEFMLNQRMLKSLSEAQARRTEPSDEKLLRIFRRIAERRNPKQHAFFGDLFVGVQAEFPFFTSRDVRNIQEAVSGRILDFELPDEWLEHPEKFYHKGYDEKKAMLVELMRGNMKGLTFWEVKLQETVMYLDEMIRIAEVTRTRTIDDGVDRILMQMEIEHRFRKLKTSGRLTHLGEVVNAATN